MTENINENTFGKCCKNIPDYLIRFNGAPTADYSVLICKLHLNKKPFDKNILFVKELKDLKIDLRKGSEIDV